MQPLRPSTRRINENLSKLRRIQPKHRPDDNPNADNAAYSRGDCRSDSQPDTLNMKTEPLKETVFTPLHSISNSVQLNANWLRSLAKEKADAGDMTAAAILQEQSDALLGVVEKLKESQ
jgi:hypothetical protein